MTLLIAPFIFKTCDAPGRFSNLFLLSFDFIHQKTWCDFVFFCIARRSPYLHRDGVKNMMDLAWRYYKLRSSPSILDHHDGFENYMKVVFLQVRVPGSHSILISHIAPMPRQIYINTKLFCCCSSVRKMIHRLMNFDKP